MRALLRADFRRVGGSVGFHFAEVLLSLLITKLAAHNRVTGLSSLRVLKNAASIHNDLTFVVCHVYMTKAVSQKCQKAEIFHPQREAIHMGGSSDKLKLIKVWELFTIVPAVVLSVLLLIQRRLVFDRADSGLFDENTGPLVLWALISCAIILATKPWVTKSRTGSGLRYFGLFTGVGSLVFLVACLTGYGRYQIARFETLHSNMGISYSPRLPGWSAPERILSQLTGPYVLKDTVMMETLARRYPEELLKSPQAARLACGALLKNGRSFQELWEDADLHLLWLACLQAEINPHPWVGYEWAKDYVEALPGGRVTTDEERKTIVEKFVAKRDSLDFKPAQSLLFVGVNFPELFSKDQLDSVFHSWAQKFKTLESLAVSGLILRDELSRFLGEEKELTVFLEKESGTLDRQMTSTNMEPYAAPQMVLSLIRSCGVSVREVENREAAQLVVKLSLTSVPIYDYRAPVYEYETYYKREYTRIGKYGSVSRQVPRQRQVQKGSETRTQYGPEIRVSFERDGKVWSSEESLFYWHHITFDHDKNRHLDAGEETDFGRMWPFGLNHHLLRYKFLTPEY